MNTDALITAVQAYFAGERHEALAVLGFLVALVLVAGSLHAVGRDGFSRGFGIVALLLAILMSPMVVSLMRRDARHQATLVAGLRSGDASAVVPAEVGRMAEVIRKYPYYRFSALGLGALALAAAALSRRGWVNGAAAGVLVLVVAQFMIDHYSEARAVRYQGELKAAVSAVARGATP